MSTKLNTKNTNKEQNNQKNKKNKKHFFIGLGIGLAIAAVGIGTAIPVTIHLTNKSKPSEETTEYTVTYEDCFSETEYTTNIIKVKKGNTTTLFNPRHRDGHGFIGWSTEKGATNPTFFDFENTPITSDLKLYGYWKHTVDTDLFEAKYNTETGMGPYVKLKDDAEIPDDGNIVVPSKLDNKEVLGVYDDGFAINNYNQIKIKSISLPDSMRAFRQNAFINCRNLSILNMPTSLETVMQYSFANCCKLKNIEFNEGLASIGTYAFAASTGTESFVENVKLPSTLQHISSEAFTDSRVKTVDLSLCSQVELAESSFSNAKYLEEVILPLGLANIPNSCFYSCSSLQTITIPDSVKFIDDSAFQYCSRLKTVNISDQSKLVYIGSSSFDSCYSLESMKFAKLFKKIGDYSFHDCSALKNITFNSSKKWYYDMSEPAWEPTSDGAANAKFLLENAHECFTADIQTDTATNLKYITDEDGSCAVIGYVDDSSISSTLTIPAVLGGYKVIGVSKNAFSDIEDIQNVVFGKDNGTIYLQYIDDSAFSGDFNITQINLSECTNLDYIGEEAFKRCFLSYESSLRINLDLTNTKLTRIGRRAFWAGENTGSPENIRLSSIAFPETLQFIGTAAFNDLKNLETLDFSNCKYLTEIENWEYTSKEGDDYGFIRNTNIKNLDLSATKLSTITHYAFWNATKLEQITLPNTVSIIGFYAFQNCTSLTGITIPQNCIMIRENAFSGCEPTTLTSIVFEDDDSEWSLVKGTEQATWEVAEKSEQENAEALVDTYKEYNWTKTN